MESVYVRVSRESSSSLNKVVFIKRVFSGVSPSGDMCVYKLSRLFSIISHKKSARDFKNDKKMSNFLHKKKRGDLFVSPFFSFCVSVVWSLGLRGFCI